MLLLLLWLWLLYSKMVKKLLRTNCGTEQTFAPRSLSQPRQECGSCSCFHAGGCGAYGRNQCEEYNDQQCASP